MAGIPESVNVKIERANHHIENLEIEIDRFLQSGPYKTVGDVDADGRAVYRVANVQPIPLSIPSIAGDAIQNMRAALDYMACALWRRTNTGECERIQFPCPSASEYKTKGLGKIQGMRQDAMDAIRSVEPYQGGNGNILWCLHRLSIIDKHRLPITIAGANIGAHLPTIYPELFTEEERKSPWILLVNMQFGLKNGDILFRDEPGRELKQNVNFPFFVAINEPGVLEKRPLLPILNSMSQFVSNAVATFAPLFP